MSPKPFLAVTKQQYFNKNKTLPQTVVGFYRKQLFAQMQAIFLINIS
ncbi:conserved hypothetical protein [Moraxellaceae bacterium 17A]|nr:conserved hypothetical protein [Moraxellaceae bacterium 17A]